MNQLDCKHAIDIGWTQGVGCAVYHPPGTLKVGPTTCAGCDKYNGPPRTTVTIENRPLPTPQQMATLAKAAVVGKYVLPQIKSEREATCVRCEHSRLDSSGIRWCGICGCGLTDDERKIRNLAAYEENLPQWGCKHPQRAQGKGWKR